MLRRSSRLNRSELLLFKVQNLIFSVTHFFGFDLGAELIWEWRCDVVSVFYFTGFSSGRGVKEDPERQ